MSANLVRDLRSALERIRLGVLETLETLQAPYRTLLDSAPDSAVGTPHPLHVHDVDSHLGRMAERVLERGGLAAPLFEVERFEQIVDALVTDYRSGSYAMETVTKWCARLDQTRKDACAALDAAVLATDTYASLKSGRERPASKSGLSKDILAPEDLVQDLGIGVAAVRKRIRNGNLGPWTREGGRWMILKKDFEAWLSAAAMEIQAGKSTIDAKRSGDVVRLLERRQRRRGGTGGKQKGS